MRWRYYAASSQDDDRAYAHSFCAPNVTEARKVCDRNGWKYDGEIVDTVEYIETEQVLLH